MSINKLWLNTATSPVYDYLQLVLQLDRDGVTCKAWTIYHLTLYGKCWPNPAIWLMGLANCVSRRWRERRRRPDCHPWHHSAGEGILFPWAGVSSSVTQEGLAEGSLEPFQPLPYDSMWTFQFVQWFPGGQWGKISVVLFGTEPQGRGVTFAALSTETDADLSSHCVYVEQTWKLAFCEVREHELLATFVCPSFIDYVIQFF